MRTILITIIFLVFFSCNSEKEISPIFYEVQSENGEVYILGSFHSLDESIYPLPNYIIEKFNDSEEFFMELKPGNISKQKQDDTFELKNHVSEETLQLVKNVADDLLIPSNVLLQLQPAEIIQEVEKNELNKIGFKNSQGIEAYFHYLARKRNIKIDGFEEYSKIMEKVQKLDSIETEKRLVYYLNNRKVIAKETKQLVEYWKFGNETGLLEKIELFTSDSPKQKDTLLYKRNRIITDKIVTMLEEGRKIFIVVGAGHIIGNDNIIEQLEKKGYIVKKIENAIQ
ncbi:MAG: TraB/GumN family protein [Bacteroidetes bacterium]|nr:TraB/GumN family protein [Bacteroidota bacterium]MBU1114380.1 TraB/GumN family protein [Bacteroidota bacterium]MBU1798325.1 TraB/GumN family protein [Bacteroidota bacterium]